MIQNNVMAVNTYELNKNNDYVMVNNVLVMNPQEDIRYAVIGNKGK